MKILFALGLVLLLVSGCGSIIKPDSRAWETAACSGFSGWDECKQKASAACSKGFEMGYQEENMVTQKRTMQYSCK